MSDTTGKDQVFAKPLSDVGAFEFNDKVAQVFRDMVSRSVPGYEMLVQLIGLYAGIFVQPQTNVYDLGCSLGEVTQTIADQITDLDSRVIAIDNSAAMINRCKQRYGDNSKIEWLCEDIENCRIDNASLVVLNLTLQFVGSDRRQQLINDIYQGLVPGGLLVLSEKIILEDNQENERMVQLYHAFKKSQGYSDLEISQKRTALEKVLVADSGSTHNQRLKNAGFGEVYQYFRAFNFCSYLAIK